MRGSRLRCFGADHLHVGIHAGDILTTDATPDTHVGQLVIDQHDDGTITMGMLQRERLHEQRPGEFYIDVGDHRVYVSEENGRMPTGHTLGVIEHHERALTLLAVREPSGGDAPSKVFLSRQFTPVRSAASAAAQGSAPRPSEALFREFRTNLQIGVTRP